MSRSLLKPLHRRALWLPSPKHLLALRTLPLLLLVNGLRGHLLQLAAADGLSGPVPTIESAATPTAAPQGTALSTVGGRAPASVPTDVSPTKTADQWMVEGRKAQKADNQMEAVNDFLNAQRLAPNSPEPLYALGMSFFFMGLDESDSSYYDRAARHFKAALELDPQYDRAAFMMGMMEVVHNRLKEAEPYFQKAIGLSPQNHFYHLYYGTLLDRMGKYDGAIEQMLLAEKLSPSYPQSYLSLGQLYSRMRKYQEARIQLERAVHLNPSLTEAYYTLGGVYHHLGKNSESQSAYETFQRQITVQPKPDPLEKAMQGSPSVNPK